MANGTPRFGIVASDDNTGRVLVLKALEPAYAATLSIKPNASKTYLKPATLTGAMTINCVETFCAKYDELVVILTSDTTSRTVTFGTNFITAGTIAPAISKQATISFVYDGANFVETKRAIQA